MENKNHEPQETIVTTTLEKWEAPKLLQENWNKTLSGTYNPNPFEDATYYS